MCHSCNISSNFYLIIQIIILIFSVHFINGDVTDFFDELVITSPPGPFFPGDKIKFTCTSRKYDGGGGELNWFFKIDQALIITAEVEDVSPEESSGSGREEEESLRKSLVRTSYIKIPQNGAQQIACQWTKGEEEYKKFLQIDVQSARVFDKDSVYELLESSNSPQIVLERFDPVEPQKRQRRHPSPKLSLEPHFITNESIWLPWEIKSFRLSCYHLGQLGDYNWTLSSPKETISSAEKSNPTILLNNMALIQRVAVSAGRYPTSCQRSYPQPLIRGVQVEVLEIIIPPLDKPQSTIYTCQGPPGSQISSKVTITFIGNQNKNESHRNSDQDKELLDLINIVMQILQTSDGSSASGGGGGNGPIMGVGFGSSTIMILMALTIFYLKKQLKQVQDQVKNNERKKLKQSAGDGDDEEIELR